MTSTPPSGELYASARDLARFALFDFGRSIADGRVERGATGLLSERRVRELHEPVFVGPRGIATTFG